MNSTLPAPFRRRIRLPLMRLRGGRYTAQSCVCKLLAISQVNAIYCSSFESWHGDC
jgi:hypothetical protein